MGRFGSVAAAVAAAAAAGLGAAPGAHAASPDVVISQVYGGGGNSGATLTNDFIELYNRGGAPVSVEGWSVQYASASGTTWQVTRLTGSVAAGGRYLIRQAAGAGGTTPLPEPDASGSIAMSATSGKVALVTAAGALACGSDCDRAAGVRDFVGYGGANDFEGSAPAPTLSNTTAALRVAGDAVDTDDNAADFRAGTPAPRSAPPPPPERTARIREIQGTGHISPLAGVDVGGVVGVVTAKTSREFWMQDPAPDADPATSEGILVFGSSAASSVAVGDLVTVAGRVTEFRPGSSSGPNLSLTQISSPQVTVTARDQEIPAATLVGPGGRVPPASVIDDDAFGSVETSGVFEPAGDGIDFWESMEGMLVRLDDPEVVGPRNNFGESVVVPPGSGLRTSRGGIVIAPNDFNPERVILDDVLAAEPATDVGDVFDGSVVGPLGYDFGNFRIQPLAYPAVRRGGIDRESTAPAGPTELAVATFNVENLSARDAQAKFDELAATVVDHLGAPDLVALEEIQDDTGPTSDGTVAAGQTLQRLVDAVAAAGGPQYRWRQIDPVDGADGGQPGGNIRLAFMFRTDRGLEFVDRPGGDATTATEVTGRPGRPELSLSPGRIAPTSVAWQRSRKPLAGEFRWRGRTLFAIANHFNSKGGDQPLFGRFQPPARVTEAQRHAQAQEVRAFVDEILARDRNANVVVLGDINDFEFSRTIDILTTGGDLVDLPRTLPASERYTYVFEGNSQVLDHILLSRGLTESACGCVPVYEYDIVHVNAEFDEQTSDHDPQVVRLDVRALDASVGRSAP